MPPDATPPAPPPARSGTFRLFGIPVRFHFTFLLVVVYLVMLGFSGRQSALYSVAYIAAIFASVLLHEIGHILVARRYGIGTDEIVMFPIGGVARLQRAPAPAEELWIALAGPAVNFVLAAVFLSLAYGKGAAVGLAGLSVPEDGNLLARIGLGNLALGLFNLIPAFPMDGGRVLRALLARWKGEGEGTRLATTAGRALAIAMGLYGLLGENYLLVFIAFFVYIGAAQEGAAAMGRSLSHGIPVRAAMVTDFRTLPHGATIQDAVNLLLASSQQDFPVLHGERVIGLLTRAALVRALALEGAEGYVSGAMDREFVAIAPDLDLAEALPLMAGSGSCALVLEEERLLGLLTAENLSEFLLLRRVGLDPAALRSA